MTNDTPDIVFKNLIKNVNSQKHKNLVIMNEVLRENYESQNSNYTIAHIARLCRSKSGPSESTIRNSSGLCYRELIASWKKKHIQRESPDSSYLGYTKDDINFRLLDLISDPAIRSLVGRAISERSHYRQEVNLLKSNANIVIDNRPNRIGNEMSVGDSLNQMEIEALKYAISDDLFGEMNWVVGKTGQVYEQGLQVYPHGYVTAIKKILNSL